MTDVTMFRCWSYIKCCQVNRCQIVPSQEEEEAKSEDGANQDVGVTSEAMPNLMPDVSYLFKIITAVWNWNIKISDYIIIILVGSFGKSSCAIKNVSITRCATITEIKHFWWFDYFFVWIVIILTILTIVIVR